MLPNPLGAVIFDMDGLLLDTERIYLTAIIAAGKAVGFDISEAFCHRMIGIPGRESEIMLQEHLGPDFPIADYLTHCRAGIAEAVESGIPLKPGAIELTAELSRRGIPTAIATSSGRRSAERYLGKAGLRERFGVIVTRDDVRHGKPKPDLFLKAAASLGIEPGHCLVLEDSHNGIRAAHAAMTMPVMVPDILPPSDEIRTMCIAVLGSLDDVHRLLGGPALHR